MTVGEYHSHHPRQEKAEVMHSSGDPARRTSLHCCSTLFGPRTQVHSPGRLYVILAASRDQVRAVENSSFESRMKKAAAWPLLMSTLRYLWEGSERAAVDVCEVFEEAPRGCGNARWTVRGFYGEYSGEGGEGVISRLGVVWGRG